jgi:hypothetical protein
MQSRIKWAVCIMLTVLLSGCTAGANSQPPLAKVPQYPSAKDIVVEPAHFTDGHSEQRTSFSTDASSDSVLSFYRNALLSNGWKSGR